MRKEGWKIRVTHLRYTWAKYKQCKSKYLKNNEKELAIVQVSDNDLYPQHEVPGFAVYPCGGITKLEITSPSGKDFNLYHKFHC